MFTLYFYMALAFILGLTTRSVGVPMIVYALYHCCFYYPLFGTGFVSTEEYLVWYTLAFFLHAILGWELACCLGVPNVFRGRVKNCKCVPHKPEVYPFGQKPDAKSWIIPFVYRFFMALLVIILMVCSTLAFELISLDLAWVGIIVSLLCIVVVHVIFWLAFTAALPPMWLKQSQAVYLHGQCEPHCMMQYHKMGEKGKIGMKDINKFDMTIDVTLYMAFYFVGMSLAFCIVFAMVPTFWQFWTSLIIFGVYAVFYLVAHLAWMTNRKNVTGVKKEGIGCGTPDP